MAQEDANFPPSALHICFHSNDIAFRFKVYATDSMWLTTLTRHRGINSCCKISLCCVKLLKYAAFDVEEKYCNAPSFIQWSDWWLNRSTEQISMPTPLLSKFITSTKAFQPSISCDFTRKKGREKCHMTHENNNIKIRKQSLCNYLIFNSHSTPSKLRSSVEAEEDTLSQKFRALKKFPFVNRVFLNFSFVSGKCLPGADGRSEKDFFMR